MAGRVVAVGRDVTAFQPGDEVFGESGLGFEARGFIPDIGHVFDVETELRLAIYAKFAENGVQIPFPQRDIHIKDLDRLTQSVVETPQSTAPRPDGNPDHKPT